MNAPGQPADPSVVRHGPAQLEVELAGLESVKLLVLAGEQYRYAVHDSHWEHEVPMKSASASSSAG